MKYEITNQIFNNFKDFETYSSGNSRNVIFNIISPQLENGIWIDSESSKAYLETLESSLRALSSRISKREFKNFKSRLSAKDLFKSDSALTEILTAYEIGHKLGFENVDFQYTLDSGKKPDIRFNVNGQYVCLELTILNPRPSEIRIFDILTDLAQYILKKCSGDNYLISVYFDTSNLKSDQENNIDEELSRNFLFNAVDNLHLDKLTGWNGGIEFSNLHLEPQKYLHDIISSNEVDFSRADQDLVNAIRNDDQFRNWTQKVLAADFSNAPFDRISFFTNATKANNACVEIQTRDFDTNDPAQQDNELYITSKKVKSAFISQIIRKLKDKVNALQYKEGYPVIIAIRGSEWRYDFENDYDDLVPIRDSIIEYLNNFPQISGVILFSSSFYNGKYVENPAASANVKVSKSALEKLGIIGVFAEPQLSKDKKITLSNFSDDEKIKVIKRILKLESTLILDDDKRSLLESIYEFLDMCSASQTSNLAVGRTLL